MTRLAADLGPLLRHQQTAVRFGGLGAQVLKRRAQGAFVADAMEVVLLERLGSKSESPCGTV